MKQTRAILSYGNHQGSASVRTALTPHDQGEWLRRGVELRVGASAQGDSSQPMAIVGKSTTDDEVGQEYDVGCEE